MSTSVEGAVDGQSQLPSEFDEVTSEMQYPPLTKDTTEKEFVKRAGNGYMTWVVVGAAGGVVGFVLFVWGIYGIFTW
jgi:hypothetical protein